MAKQRAPATPPMAEHPAVGYQRAIVENLHARTGRTLAEWIALVRNDGPPALALRARWLAETFSLGSTTAKLIAREAGGPVPAYQPGVLESKLFAGSRAAMRPVYDRLLAVAARLGDDVTITPCRTIIPFRRRHVIAEVKPLASRVDFGLALGRATGALPARLVATGGKEKGDRITHRVPLTAAAEVDGFVERWLARAYDLDA